MEINNQIRDGAILLTSYILIFITTFFMPTFILFAIFLLPIPIVIFASRHERIAFFRFVGITAIVVFLFILILGIIAMIPLVVLTLSGGVAIGDAIQRKKTSYETWINGIIGFVFGFLFVFLYTQFVLEINWADEIELMVDQAYQNFVTVFDQIEQFDSTDQFKDQVEDFKGQMMILKDLIPAGIAIVSIIMAFMTQWISYRLIDLLDGKQLRFPPIRKLQFPTAIVWIYIIALLVILFENNTSSSIFIGAQNIITLTGFLMIIQGFSFLFFFVHYKKRTNVLPIVVIVISILLPLLFYVVRVLGLIDIAFSLREQMNKSKEG